MTECFICSLGSFQDVLLHDANQAQRRVRVQQQRQIITVRRFYFTTPSPPKDLTPYPLPTNISRSSPPSNLPIHTPPRLSLLPPRPVRPRRTLQRSVAVASRRFSTLLFRAEKELLQRLLRQDRLVLDYPRLLHLPLYASVHGPIEESRPNAEEGTSRAEMGDIDVVVDGHYAVVLWPAVDRSRVQVDGRTM